MALKNEGEVLRVSGQFRVDEEGFLSFWSDDGKLLWTQGGTKVFDGDMNGERADMVVTWGDDGDSLEYDFAAPTDTGEREHGS